MPDDDRASLKFISAALQRINEYSARDGYLEARAAIQPTKRPTRQEVQQIVSDFCGEWVRMPEGM